MQNVCCCIFPTLPQEGLRVLLTWTLERDKGGGRRDERCINGELSSGKYAIKSILSTCIYFLATFCHISWPVRHKKSLYLYERATYLRQRGKLAHCCEPLHKTLCTQCTLIIMTLKNKFILYIEKKKNYQTNSLFGDSLH